MSRVAGLPLLDRLILSLWRAGVAHVKVLMPARARHCLARHLSRLARRGGGVEIVSGWEALAESHDHPWVVLSADTLPAPDFLARFLAQPLEPGHAAVAVTAPPPPGEGVARGGLLPCPGLARFSPGAWRGFGARLREAGVSRPLKETEIRAPLCSYLDDLERERQLLRVAAEPGELLRVSRREEVKEAAEGLVAALPGSPWGEGFLEYSLNRRLARRLLLRLATAPVTPNQITALDLSLGLVAVLLFLTGNYWLTVLGAALLPLVVVLDMLDGMLARLTFRETRLGRLLDLYGDTFLNLLIFLALAVGRYQATGQRIYLLLLIPLAAGYLWCWWLTDPLWGRWGAARPRQRPEKPPSSPGRVVRELASRDFVYLILLGALLDRLEWFVVGVALGTHLFALAFVIGKKTRSA